MAKIKLFGLVLMITTFFLAMAAIVTSTSHLRLHRTGAGPVQADPAYDPSLPNNAGGNFDPYRDPNWRAVPGVDPDLADIQFVSIPVIVPLGFAGLLGILLWFTPHKTDTTRYTKKRYRSPRRKY